MTHYHSTIATADSSFGHWRPGGYGQQIWYGDSYPSSAPPVNAEWWKYVSNITYVYPGESATIPERKSEQSQKKEDSMRGLFEVFIVDPESGDVLGPYRVVAKDEGTAKLKVVARQLDADKVDVDDYDVIVRRIGDVRPKKVVQTVKLAKE